MISEQGAYRPKTVFESPKRLEANATSAGTWEPEPAKPEATHMFFGIVSSALLVFALEIFEGAASRFLAGWLFPKKQGTHYN